jgi:hypothetical protein
MFCDGVPASAGMSSETVYYDADEQMSEDGALFRLQYLTRHITTAVTANMHVYFSSYDHVVHSERHERPVIHARPMSADWCCDDVFQAVSIATTLATRMV